MANDIVTQAIERVASGSDLSSEEAARVLREVMEGRVGETQTAGFLIALRTKGETVDEVAGLAKTMRELGVRTIFNLLGPLTNPAAARRQLIGVSDPSYLQTMAGALSHLGSESALIVSAEDGLDELSVSAPTRVVELRNGEIDSYTITPEEAGVEPMSGDALAQGDPDENAALTRAVLAGKANGVERSLVVLNAGAALYVAGVSGSIQAGVGDASDALDSGAAADLLERYVARTQALAPA